MNRFEQRDHWERRINELYRIRRDARCERDYGDGGYWVDDLLRLIERELQWVTAAYDRCW